MDDGIPIPFLLQAILGTSTSEVFNTFNATVAIELLFTLILLIFTAMMCAVEVAIFLFTTQEINELERSNDETDAIILDFIKKPRRFLATFVLTTTLFTLAVVLMFENVLETILKHEFIEANSSLLLIIKILFETFIIVLFAEVIPKLYATQQYYKVAKNTVHLLRIFDILFSPFVRALLATSNFFEKRLAGFSNNVTAKDIDEAIDITTSQENDEAIRNDSRIL